MDTEIKNGLNPVGLHDDDKDLRPSFKQGEAGQLAPVGEASGSLSKSTLDGKTINVLSNGDPVDPASRKPNIPIPTLSDEAVAEVVNDLEDNARPIVPTAESIAKNNANVSDAQKAINAGKSLPPPPPAPPGHNAIQQKLCDIVDEVERLAEERDGINADIREFLKSAKAIGFEPKYVREVIRLRKMEKDALDERDAALDALRTALGL